MKPLKFKGFNRVFARGQSQYRALPAYKDSIGRVTSCWGLSLLERLYVLFTGRLWVAALPYNMPLQQMRLQVERPVLHG